MKNSNPYSLHHRQIIPWYDTTAVCWALIIFMLAVFGFAIVGISVARSEAKFQSYLWVPAALCAVSGAVLFSLAWRLLKRRLRRGTE